MMISIDKKRLQKAEKCLADNGIETDETSIVLQAIGYILLDVELYPDDKKEPTLEIVDDDLIERALKIIEEKATDTEINPDIRTGYNYALTIMLSALTGKEYLLKQFESKNRGV